MSKWCVWQLAWILVAAGFMGCGAHVGVFVPDRVFPNPPSLRTLRRMPYDHPQQAESLCPAVHGWPLLAVESEATLPAGLEMGQGGATRGFLEMSESFEADCSEGLSEALRTLCQEPIAISVPPNKSAFPPTQALVYASL